MFFHERQYLIDFVKTFFPIFGFEIASGITYFVIFAMLGQFGDPFPINVLTLNYSLQNLVDGRAIIPHGNTWDQENTC